MTKLFRNGAGILFVLSLLVFVGVLAFELLLVRSAGPGEFQQLAPPVWVEVIAAISGALSAAAIPFFGACVIDRADKILALRSREAGQ